MTRRPFMVLTTLTFAVASLLVGGTAPAVAAKPSVSMSTPATILLGEKVSASGTTSTGFRRKVVLQRHDSRGWSTIASGTTSGRRYTLVDPSPSRVGRYRIHVPATRYEGRRFGASTSASRTTAIRNELVAGQKLTAGRGIRSTNGTYRLLQQKDGNLVVYRGHQATWSASSNGPDRFATMQADGNFVVYAGDPASPKAVWSSSTQGAAGSRLVMQDDGNLVVYSAGRIAMWSSGTGHTGASQSSLQGSGAVKTLRSGQSLISPDGAFRAVMQADGNFVVYDSAGRARWASNTAGVTGGSVVMQADGNLVVYSAAGAARWSSSTAPAANSVLVMQNDGNLVLYSQGGLPLWASNGGRTGYGRDSVPAGGRLTVGQRIISASGSHYAVMQGDGNLVKYTAAGAAQWSSNTAGSGADRVVVQGDGNLVVYSGGTARWSSRTSGANARLVMQDDGNLVVYSGSTALWDASSNGAPGGSTTGAVGAFASWALNPANWNSTTDKGRRGIDSDGWYGAQCADLGIAWSKQAGRPSGFDGWDAASKSKPGWHHVGGNFAAARPGDVITRVNGTQHVVVVTGAPSGGSVQVLQQNPGSPAEASYSTAATGVIWRLN